MLINRLNAMHACSESLEWVGKRVSPRAAWMACPRGDWLLWVAEQLGVDHRLLVLAACDCAASVGDDPAIEAARGWAVSEATVWKFCADVRGEVYKLAAELSMSGYKDKDIRRKLHVAKAARGAVDSVLSHFRAYEAALWAARVTNHRACAVLVRKRIPWAVVEGLVNGV